MEPLKHGYSKEYTTALTSAVTAVAPSFDSMRFTNLVFDEVWEGRELKDRMHHLADCLQRCLPGSYADQLAVLLRVGDQFGGFLGMFVPDFVERFGQDEWDLSLAALETMTPWSSSEFAVRPFILQRPQEMAARMLGWAKDENYHVRRLASEGCRPRLPWACALPMFKQDPGPILPILEQLKRDPEDYVRRSVANNLNDISKDHPELVLDLAKRWLGEDSRTDWIVKHACRTLLKAGRPEAMTLFGFGNPASVLGGVELTLDPATVPLGGELRFDIVMEIRQSALLRLEYAVHFRKANGSLSRKVFKISEREHQAGVSRHGREHKFKDLSTRRHHAGLHRLDLIVNGVVAASADFMLGSAPLSEGM